MASNEDSDYSPSSHVSNDAQILLNEFWHKQVEDIRNLTTVGMVANDFKQPELPLARIKKIMKLDDDVKMISAEAPVLFSKAAELFINELTLRAWVNTEENKRRTLQRNDIAMAISKYDQFDFLIDIVPRDELKPPKKPEEPVRHQAAMVPEQVQYYFQMPVQSADGANPTQQIIVSQASQASNASQQQSVQVTAGGTAQHNLQQQQQQQQQPLQQLILNTQNSNLGQIFTVQSAATPASAGTNTTGTEQNQVATLQGSGGGTTQTIQLNPSQLSALLSGATVDPQQHTIQIGNNQIQYIRLQQPTAAGGQQGQSTGPTQTQTIQQQQQQQTTTHNQMTQPIYIQQVPTTQSTTGAAAQQLQQILVQHAQGNLTGNIQAVNASTLAHLQQNGDKQQDS